MASDKASSEVAGKVPNNNERLLRRQAALRFGEETAARLAGLLAHLAGAVHLAEAGEWIVSDKPPSQYFPQLLQKSGRDAFRAQCIPTDSRLLEVDAYKSFLDERRRLVGQRLNEFLAVGQA